MSESKIGDIVSTLLSGVHGISKTETIVGQAQQAGDATVIPVHRLKIAFGAGSATAGGKSAKLGGKSGGHGAGGAVELDPVAVIAIGKDGSAQLLTVEGDESSAWSSLLRDVPDILGRLTQSVAERMRAELNARSVAVSEIGAPAEAPQRAARSQARIARACPPGCGIKKRVRLRSSAPCRARAAVRARAAASTRRPLSESTFKKGRKRTPRCPQARTIRCSLKQRLTTRLRSSVEGKSMAHSAPRPRALLTSGKRPASASRPRRSSAPRRVVFSSRRSSSTISRMRVARTMSTSEPPQVLEIRLGTENTLSTSSIRGDTSIPPTCIFLAKHSTSGWTPSFWNAHQAPVSPTPVCTSSKISSASRSSAMRRSPAKNSGRK